jgi:FkbM family methyltransferase
MRELMRSIGLGVPYRLGVEASVRVITMSPMFEQSFVGVSRVIWAMPVVGRFCRSIGYTLVNELHGRGDSYRDVNVAGTALKADVSGWVFSGIYLANVEYEPLTTRFIVQHLNAGHSFVDIGANSGYFAMLAASLVGPTGRVFAFEPNPTVFQELVAHVDLNKFGGRVQMLDYALSDVSAENVSLFVLPHHKGFGTLVENSGLLPEHFGIATAVAVRTRTFDEWRTEQGLERVDVMKIDVDGAEERVLLGMRESLASGRIGHIVCETEWGSRAHQTLVDHGYRPTVLENLGPVLNISYDRDELPSV